MIVMRMVTGGNKWRATAIGEAYSCCNSIPSLAFPNFSSVIRKGSQHIIIRQTNVPFSNAKKTKLNLTRKDRMKLLSSGGGIGVKAYHISEFPKQPFGLAISSASEWRCFQFFDSNSYSTRSITTTNSKEKKKKRSKEKLKATEKPSAKMGLVKEKRRTRSSKEYEYDSVIQQSASHIPVLLGEVLDVFSSSRSISSFIDCTLGAAGHSSAIIQAHPELKLYIGMDVDPSAYELAQTHLDSLLQARSDLQACTFLKNFRHIKSVLGEVDENILKSGVDGILMDLGMSSMQVNNPERGFSVLGNGPLDMRMDPQASLKAEDILNSWPDAEVGRVLRDYGEESNWYLLQKKIVKARLHGGLHTTSDLLSLIRNMTPREKGGRQGWIKTATRVFQALRIAVNDELNVLENSLYACFDCLAPGGRLAVITFHSLEDRIVKQTFLSIIDCNREDAKGSEEEKGTKDGIDLGNESTADETWIRHTVRGRNGIILTKRPITPSEKEEKLNRRCRSAKLRVIQKV